MDPRVTPDEGHLSVMGLGVRQREEHSSSLGRVLWGLLHTQPSPLGHLPPFPRMLPFGLLSWVCHRGPAVGVTGYPSKLSRAKKKKKETVQQASSTHTRLPHCPKGAETPAGPAPLCCPAPTVSPSFAQSRWDWRPPCPGDGCAGKQAGPRLASCLSTVLKGRAGWS